MLLGPMSQAGAYTPESPEVRAMLDKAFRFLDQAPPDSRLGAKSLVGLALVKGDRPRNHPKIQQAVTACQQAAQTLESAHKEDVIYDLSLSIIFLCELDPELHRNEIVTLTELLIKWQKDFGGWGYLGGPHIPTGDTSMTQYAVLALWTAERSGAFRVDPIVAVKVCNWLLRTQDPSGGWGYQGKDPGDFRRVPQLGVQQSLTAAGCGSVYVLADLLRLTDGIMRRDPNEGLPPALRIVSQPDQRPSQGPLTREVDQRRLKVALHDGDQWLDKNFVIDPPSWRFYYIYALERYKSFRELATGRIEAKPDWYNVGVTYLQKSQSKEGSWQLNYGADVETSFAVLFLMRGTRKSIEKAEAFSGSLRGGRGLPQDTARVTLGEDGRISKTPFQGKAESLLAILEAAGEVQLESLGSDIVVTLSDEPEQRERELERLRRLVADDEYAVRLAALQALINVRDLDNVPVLIFALSDPDPEIVRRARDALRVLSRKIDGFGLSDDPTEGAKLDVIQRWKEWFLALRPDAQFLN